MKKILLATLATLALAGCKTDSDYDMEATRAQVRAECEEYGGKAITMRITRDVNNRPWAAVCINSNTGAEFNVYVSGVLQ